MTFRLKIETGNDAMQTWSDVAQALSVLVAKFEGVPDDVYRMGTPETIRDLNGNKVGQWRIS